MRHLWKIFKYGLILMFCVFMLVPVNRLIMKGTSDPSGLGGFHARLERARALQANQDRGEFSGFSSVGDHQNYPAQGPGEFSGWATWYGQEFAGRPTASGSIYDPNAYTIATNLNLLPLGSKISVSNPKNNRSLIARVTDRGPWENHVENGRIIVHRDQYGRPKKHPLAVFDLSARVAHELGIKRAGKGWVIVKIIAAGT